MAHRDDFPIAKTQNLGTSQLAAEPGLGKESNTPSVEEVAAWQRVVMRMRKDVGDVVWSNWIKPLVLLMIDQGVLHLQTQNQLTRDRAATQYADRLRLMACAEGLSVRSVMINLASARAKAAISAVHLNSHPDENAHYGHDAYPLHDAPRLSQMQSGQNSPFLSEAGFARQTETSHGLDQRFTFDRFVVGKPNELAFAASRNVAESPNGKYNPLFLYGGVGLGKTHLMHAIAWDIHQRYPDRKVMYLSAERFMYRFIQALRQRDTMAFKEQFRSADVLMIDDVQFICGKESTQEEFFHTFNALVDEGKQVILSADKSPSDLPDMEERLRSRLGWGMVADIHPANYELRLGILQSHDEKAIVKVPNKVLEFIALRVTSNIRELEGAYKRIHAQAELVGRDITVEMAKDVLKDLLRASSRRTTLEDIQKKVAGHFSIRLSDMSSNRRTQTIARPRQIAMYLSKMLTTKSYPEIGNSFGGRDHTTVMHAVKRVEELMARDQEFADDVELLRTMLAEH